MVLTFADKLLRVCRLSPLLLLKSFAASITLRPTGIMLALAEQLLWLVRVKCITGIGVTIAHAPSSNADIFDGVKVLRNKKFSSETQRKVQNVENNYVN